mgnify:FL=1
MPESQTVVELLSPIQRKRLYIVFAIISGVIGATLAGFAAVSMVAPVGLIFASTFFNFLGTAFGIFAASNITEPSVSPPPQVTD